MVLIGTHRGVHLVEAAVLVPAGVSAQVKVLEASVLLTEPSKCNHFRWHLHLPLHPSSSQGQGLVDCLKSLQQNQGDGLRFVSTLR
jgi:hypothetical protein